MQPDHAEAFRGETRRSPVVADRCAVQSRRRALDRLHGSFRGIPTGPLLITGEPGAGKTWLVHRLVEGLPAGWRRAFVELTTALDGLETLRLVGAELGLAMPDRLGAARLMLGEGLRQADADGRRWLLIVDEAQRASAGAWEEIQVLSNQLGGAGGFAALILLGRTELAARRPRDGSSRLGLHIHLPPLDLDEAREFLGPEGRLTEPELEALHRDALGNPRAMRRLAEARAWASRPAASTSTAAPGRPAASFRIPRAIPRAEVRLQGTPDGADSPDGGGIPRPAEEPVPSRHASLIPSRPPLRLEDGLVEVGWEGDLEAEPTGPEPPIDAEIGPPVEGESDEQLVEDRYAALQAWAEWSRNRERSSPTASDHVDIASDERADPGPLHAGGPREDVGSTPAPSVRAESQHDFAPYSQLFTRLRHSL